MEEQDKKQLIIEGLIATLGYREQKIDELEHELITWKTRTEKGEEEMKAQRD